MEEEFCCQNVTWSRSATSSKILNLKQNVYYNVAEVAERTVQANKFTLKTPTLIDWDWSTIFLIEPLFQDFL